MRIHIVKDLGLPAGSLANMAHAAFIGAAMFFGLAPGGVAQEIRGQVELPAQWTAFAPFDRDDPVPSPDILSAIPEEIAAAGRTVAARQVTPVNNQFDFSAFAGMGRESVAYVFVPLRVPSARTATLGMGADWRLQAWLNGEEIFDNTRDDETTPPYPPSINDFRVEASLREGMNVLAVRLVGGSGSAALALGGPDALRAGNFQSILNDPFLMVQALPESRWSGAERWTRPHLRAEAGDKPAAEIGTRLELFVDDFLIDAMTGGAERRLHHPTHREVVLRAEDAPWEGGIAYFSALQDEGRVRLYYSARPPERGAQMACLAESEDGVLFSRPNLGLFEYEGSTENNIVWRRGPTGHHFTPFIDTNPAAPPEARYKGIGRPPRSGMGGALIGFVSPDGIHWDVADPEGGFATSPTDSQNQAFWDPLRETYVCYMRGRPERRGRVRDIRVSFSKDFVNWSEPEDIEYTDDRREHMYTNGIQPYFRAPHIYIGLPNRMVPARKRIPDRPEGGINDTILMSSRDGKLFTRWEEGFLRPNSEIENWGDRNHYIAWGMVQLSPEEITLYWTEHNRFPTKRLRRGTIRTDGFVSVRAGGEVGEMLTRPLVFSGDRLIVNYATSALGTIRFEICDPNGEPLQGFSLGDSELLYGNEIEHMVAWHGRIDLGALAGRPVRLRVRLQDADLYSIRFASSQDIREQMEAMQRQAVAR